MATGFPHCDQPRQVTVCRMMRHPGHRNRLPGGLPALSEGQIQQFGDLARIIKEQFVKKNCRISGVWAERSGVVMRA